MELTEKEQQVWDELLERILRTPSGLEAHSYAKALNAVLYAIQLKNQFGSNDGEEE